jgi:hypothetical protein
VALTADPARHAERILAAATASVQAGAFGKALELLDSTEDLGSGPLDEFQHARADLLRAHVAFASGMGSDAPPLLLKAAERLQSLDLELARETYLTAWVAANFAGRFVGAGDVYEISRAALAVPPARPPRPIDLLLDGLAVLFTEGRARAAPALREAVRRFATGDIATQAQRTLARETGALDQLPIDLVALALSTAWRGELATAAALITETDAICEITGSRIAPYTHMFLAALRGDDAEVSVLIETARAEATAGGQGAAVTYGHWVTAILHNGSGRHPESLSAARQAVEDAHPQLSMWALPELVEAATRTGDGRAADEAMERLADTTRAGGTDFGLGVEARSRALVCEGELAERCDLVIAGEDEAALLCGEPDAAILADRFGVEAVVTHGERGASGCRAGELADVPGIAVAAVDVVGAGDAFTAGYLDALLDGASLADALRRANACGAIAVSAVGDATGLPTRAELDRVLAGGGDVVR